MSTMPLEERVARLEAEVTRLKRHLAQTTPASAPWWETITGTFANDPAFDEAMQLGRRYRASYPMHKDDMQGDDVSA